MRAGRLRHRVVIQEPDNCVDAYGGPSHGWSDVARVFADIRPVRGQERLETLQVSADVTHTVIMRYRSGVTPKMRIRYGTRLLNVISVLNVGERNKQLELLCSEQV